MLADECRPAVVVRALRAASVDTAYVAEESPGISDEAVVARAQADGRILLTEDYDFGELTIRRRLPVPGLIILALGREPPAERAVRTVAMVTALEGRLAGHVTVIGANGVRHRPLHRA